MNLPARPLRIGYFTVHDDRLIVVDDRAPVVVELDVTTGAVVRIRTWEIPPWSGQEVASDVEVAGGEIVVASPAAGGVVFFPGDAAAGELLAFDVPIRELVPDGDAIWAIAASDGWGGADPVLGWRPQVVIEPTAEEIAEHKARAARWLENEVGAENALVILAEWPDEPDNGEEAGDDEGERERDRSEAVRAPTPMWRIVGRVATAVDLGAVVSLYPVNEGLFVVCERPDDPIVVHVDPEHGGGSYTYTVSILAGTPEAGFAVLRSASEIRHVVGVSGQRIWLDASGGDDFDRTGRVLALDFDGSETLIELPLADVWEVVGDRVLGQRRHDTLIAQLGSDSVTEISMPSFNHWEARVVVGDRVYYAPDEGEGVVAVDLSTGAVLSVSVDVDCAPYLPDKSVGTDVPPITLPVRLDGWELECCQPDAVVGEPWTVTMLLDQEPHPWWAEYSPEPVPDDVRSFGVVEVDGAVLREAAQPEDAALVAVGPVRLAVVGARADQQRFRGVVSHEAHGGVDGVLYSEIEATGVVRRIQGLSYQRRHMVIDGEPASWPVAQNPPVDLPSTVDGGFETYLLTIEFGAAASD